MDKVGWWVSVGLEPNQLPLLRRHASRERIYSPESEYEP